MGEQAAVSGPDLAAGVAEGDLQEGATLLGHVGDQAVVLVRAGGQVHALGASCTHYGGPLAEGVVANGAIRCPWHHACFDLATGRAHGPAIAPVACFDVALEGGKLRVGKQREAAKPAPARSPASVVIVGGGAAGTACAEALRAEGYTGPVTLITAEGSDPVDRPNLSKDYLAGNAPEEWVYLRTADALAGIDVALVRGEVSAIDRAKQTVTVGATAYAYGALVLATGAEPIRLPIPGADLPHVHTLRTLADSKAIAAGDGPVVVIGASFIGLEAAAALRARGRDVTVVAPEAVPLARVLGDRVGAFLREVHEGKGVAFRLGRKPAAITATHVELDDGTKLPAKTVVVGVGVKPRTQLAEAAGLPIDPKGGVTVDADLRAADHVFACGDIARVPYAGGTARIEHWQVAVRHGQRAARSILGAPHPRADIPFFWSAHHDVTLGYVGHAEQVGAPEVHGELAARDAHIVYRDPAGKVAAVVTLGRDKLALDVEAAMERGDNVDPIVAS